MDETSRAILTVSGVLFGFFFAAFWWILNRELTFKEEERHSKPTTGVLMASMALLAAFGIGIPLRRAAQANPALLTSYHGILLALNCSVRLHAHRTWPLRHLPAAQIYDAQ